MDWTWISSFSSELYALYDVYTECTNVLMDCCVNFGSQTICTTPSARCCEKDFLSNTDIGQPTAQNTAYIPSAGLFEVGLQMYKYYMCIYISFDRVSGYRNVSTCFFSLSYFDISRDTIQCRLCHRLQFVE